MFHENEFDLLCQTFEKSRVRVVNTGLQESVFALMDEWMLSLFENVIHREITVSDALGTLEHNVLYRFRDMLFLSYLAFLLPTGSNTVVVIGPYLEQPMSDVRMLEISEHRGFSPKSQKAINEFFAAIPIISDNSALLLLLDAFCERMWNGAYQVRDVYKDAALPEGVAFLPGQEKGLDDTFLDMKSMELRYRLENEIMDAVAFGAENKLQRIFSNFAESVFEKRVSDPIRNAKNYCIIMNTLFRKAAEHGGVHPIYLDRISMNFAVKIEQLSDSGMLKTLMGEMCSAYCQLVRKQSSKQYSPIVQKAVIAIDSNPASELNLHTLACQLNVSNAYLSSVFKKETGRTVTEYIREKRLAYAERLLTNTNLQIQTVALHCGMVDVQYFSKLFKKHTGKTPSQFRAQKAKN